MGVELLYYRPWRGEFRAASLSIWPIARTSLKMLFRRKLFWVFYAFGLLVFFMFFFGQFLLDWAVTQIPAAPLKANAADRLILQLRRGLSFLSGNQDTYQYYFRYQNTVLVVMMALAGSVLVGNDYTFGSLPFYLAKPVSRWHYVLGKCLAVGIIINLMTTLPALVMYVQYGFGNWDYFLDPDYFRTEDGKGGPGGVQLLCGILGYGLVLTVCMSIMLVATASWLRRTMPMILVWTGVFLFLPLIATILVMVFRYDERWRLIDLWNNLCLVGNECLGIHNKGSRPGPHPDWVEALIVLGVVCIACLTYLNRRTRGVEIVR